MNFSPCFTVFFSYAENSCPKLCVTHQVFAIEEMLTANKSQDWKKTDEKYHSEKTLKSYRISLERWVSA